MMTEPPSNSATSLGVVDDRADQPTAGPIDPWRADRAVAATGRLAAFNEAEWITSADIQVATTLARLAGESDPDVLLGTALTVRALRGGAVCLDPADAVRRPLPDPALAWPELGQWIAALRRSPLTGPGRPLVWDLERLYLHRYHQQETQVCDDLLDRQFADPPLPDRDRLTTALDRLFPAGDGAAAHFNAAEVNVINVDANQRRAAEVAAGRWTTVVCGGPGTGKTTTVARMLAVLADVTVGETGRRPRIGLAAPTGKAAARLQAAVQSEASRFGPDDRDRVGDLTASTLHRLLGSIPAISRNRFTHRRDHKLPHDIVVVDEASMLSLTLTARLLEAMRADARLILVGDPSQLESVEAGVVLADLVAGLTARAAAESAAEGRAHELDRLEFVRHAESKAPPDPEPVEPEVLPVRDSGVVTLTYSYRFGGGIADLAGAIRSGDVDGALAVLHAGQDDVRFGPHLADDIAGEVTAVATELVGAAERGDEAAAFRALDRHRLLCAHRTGPAGVALWNARIGGWIREIRRGRGEWFAGRPLLVNKNDDTVGLYNGDTGVVMRAADGSLEVLFQRGSTTTRLPPSRLSTIETAYAMTVHRSQGSQYDEVSLILPPIDSPLLTRELLYTAITRAQTRVRILGGDEQIRLAIESTATRASGLRERLAAAERTPFDSAQVLAFPPRPV